MEPDPPFEVEPELDGDEELEHPVTPLELFFDLVFVFALTQVTGFMSDDPTWAGVGKGMLILAALWWTWGAYAWLTNEIDPDEGSARLAVFAAMGAMFVAALAVPNAFSSDAVLFGLAFFMVRVLHIVLFAEATPHVDVRQAAYRLARTAIPGPALIVVAGFLDGRAQIACWLLALAIDYSGPYIFGVRGFSVSAEHFAERYGLIVIIALGESIVAIGIGAAGIELDPTVVIAAILGLGVACALWWAYFDIVALVARKTLVEAHGHERSRLARDLYSYLHLPMFAGIVLVALGAKKVLAHVDEPLDTVPAFALCGGVALYLLSHDAMRLRSVGNVNLRRCLAAATSAALIPVAVRVDGVVAIALVAAVCTALIAYETLRFRTARAQMRTAV
ncbi:MAG TPA: low temperature requirement protein A [Gaiellaceae bacterium]|jgi:low temperature requirement protein LtrA|nr:low temperature requirement protein A [Gaiellaceae bacterium]